MTGFWFWIHDRGIEYLTGPVTRIHLQNPRSSKGAWMAPVKIVITANKLWLSSVLCGVKIRLSYNFFLGFYRNFDHQKLLVQSSTCAKISQVFPYQIFGVPGGVVGPGIDGFDGDCSHTFHPKKGFDCLVLGKETCPKWWWKWWFTMVQSKKYIETNTTHPNPVSLKATQIFQQSLIWMVFKPSSFWSQSVETNSTHSFNNWFWKKTHIFFLFPFQLINVTRT